MNIVYSVILHLFYLFCFQFVVQVKLKKIVFLLFICQPSLTRLTQLGSVFLKKGENFFFFFFESPVLQLQYRIYNVHGKIISWIQDSSSEIVQDKTLGIPRKDYLSYFN